jgi:N-formylglutamate amidohydrolase
MSGELWRIDEGEGPVLGTAIHAGHRVRETLDAQLAISESQRLREEDPYTAAAIAALPTRIRVARSRFEVDLNRDEHHAV